MTTVSIGVGLMKGRLLRHSKIESDSMHFFFSWQVINKAQEKVISLALQLVHLISWLLLAPSSWSSQVILISIMIEVSRHFKVIIVLGFGTCRLGCPRRCYLNWMIGNKQHCLGSNANNAYLQVMDQENIKVMMDKCLSVNFAISTRDMLQTQILDQVSRKSTQE